MRWDIASLPTVSLGVRVAEITVLQVWGIYFFIVAIVVYLGGQYLPNVFSNSINIMFGLSVAAGLVTTALPVTATWVFEEYLSFRILLWAAVTIGVLLPFGAYHLVRGVRETIQSYVEYKQREIDNASADTVSFSVVGEHDTQPIPVVSFETPLENIRGGVTGYARTEA